MLIDKYRVNEWELRYDGVQYEDALDLIQSGMLGMCGCGSRELNLAYIRGGLALINEPRPENCSPAKANAWWWEDYFERIKKYHGGEGQKYFFYYWTDTAGLTEHGGSVPGWLTDKGKEVLGLLNEHTWEED